MKLFADCLVPLKHKNDKNSEWKRLANWVSFQRLQYKKMKKGDPSSLLTEERRQELADIGFIFSVKDDNPSSNWNSMLDELYRYKSTHGSCNVPANFELNRRLGPVRPRFVRAQAGRGGRSGPFRRSHQRPRGRRLPVDDDPRRCRRRRPDRRE